RHLPPAVRGRRRARPGPGAGAQGSEHGKPRPWSNGEGRGPDEGPVLRPVQSSAHPAPVPPAPIGNRTSAPPVAQSSAPEPQPVTRRAEPPPRRPPASKKDPEEKKGHADSRERER